MADQDPEWTPEVKAPPFRFEENRVISPPPTEDENTPPEPKRKSLLGNILPWSKTVPKSPGRKGDETAATEPEKTADFSRQSLDSSVANVSPASCNPKATGSYT